MDLDLREFEQQYQRLVRGRATSRDNTGSIQCTRCEGCIECTFCTDGVSLLRCHYCTESERLVSCTHCSGSRDLFSCTHCVDCERCVQSSYLTRSQDCTACSYLYGCVGLTGKEFHILNEPYSRSEYFAIVGKLERQRSGR